MRIGLANLPLLLALAPPGFENPSGANSAPPLFSLKNYGLLVLLKITGQAVITGTLFSFVLLFSLAGTLSSAALMYLLRRIPGSRYISLVGTGIAGAFISNAVQIVLACFLVFGESARYLAPPFLAAGIVNGGILGLFAESFAEKSQWIKRRGEPGRPDFTPPKQAPIPQTGGINPPAAARPAGVPGTAERRGLGGILRLCAGLTMALLFLLVPWLPVRAGLFLLFWITAMVLREKAKPVLTILTILVITAFNLFPPYGKVLVSLGPAVITLGSLLGGLRKAVTMEGLIMLSKVLVQGKGGLPLPGSFGKLLGESFSILEKLNETKSSKKGGLMERLDRLLCELAT
jgi:heptaprenyl diphosphate synthase